MASSSCRSSCRRRDRSMDCVSRSDWAWAWAVGDGGRGDSSRPGGFTGSLLRPRYRPCESLLSPARAAAPLAPADVVVPVNDGAVLPACVRVASSGSSSTRWLLSGDSVMRKPWCPGGPRFHDCDNRDSTTYQHRSLGYIGGRSCTYRHRAAHHCDREIAQRRVIKASRAGSRRHSLHAAAHWQEPGREDQRVRW